MDGCGGIDLVECKDGLTCVEVDDCPDTGDGPDGSCISNYQLQCETVEDCRCIMTGCEGYAIWRCSEGACRVRCECIDI